MRWDEIKVGQVVRVPKGTRRGPTVFEVTAVRPNALREGHTIVTGTASRGVSIVWFTKSDDFTAFSVKGEKEFDNPDDEC